MNIISGRIEEIYIEDGRTMGKIRVGNAYTRVPLLLVEEARVGDTVIIESGIAISRLEEQRGSEF
jgi:hydrogenase maturation factor